jgi:hypothetical protein
MKIVVNGREYSGPEQLPADAREDYERAMSALADNNGNSIPDILEMHLAGAMVKPGDPPVRVVTSHEITIDGQSFEGLDQLPTDKRQLIEEIQTKLAGLSSLPSKDSATLSSQSERMTTFAMNDSGFNFAGGSLSPMILIFGGIVIGLLIAAAVLVVGALLLK